MGRYDDISDAKLRSEIQRFARILQRMEERDEVLDRTADILTLLGELRSMVFAWEVRSTYKSDEGARVETDEEGSPAPEGVGGESETERIVREARERQSDFTEGLEDEE